MFLVEKAFLGVLVILRERLFPIWLPSLHSSVQEKGTPSEALLQQSQQAQRKGGILPPYSRCAGTFARARHFADTIWGRKKECRWPNPTKEGPAACEAIGPSWAQCSIMVKTMHLGSAGTGLRLCLDHLLMCDCRRTIASLSLNIPKMG